jgi:hypothetical protein
VKVTQLIPAAVVVVALAAIGGIAGLGRPAAPNPASTATATRQVAVTSAARACPPTPGSGSGAVALIAGAAPGPRPATGAQQGQTELTALPPAGQSLRAAAPVRAAGPGMLSLLTVPAGASTSKKGASVAQGWSVSATGTMAQAMEAEVAQSSGLGSVRCAEPGSDIWFLGPGQQNGASQIQLDLMNIDSLAASVDVSAITDAGQAQAGNDSGITVPPHQTVTESLSSLASGSSVLAVEVHTSIGRVAADVAETSAHGGTASWLPRTAAPSTQLVIPGVPSSGSAAGLILAVPGTASAKVNVVAITPQGLYRPFGSQPVELPGESASYTALQPGGTAAALEITSNVPVTAGVVVPGSGVGAFTAATAPISEQAVVAGNTSGSGIAASVVLSAPAGAARVQLTEIAEADRGGGSVTASQDVSVKAGRTLVTPVTAPRGARHGSAFALVITPLAGSGPVYAARVETQGQDTVVSIIPVASALTTIGLPPVRDSYDAVSP